MRHLALVFRAKSTGEGEQRQCRAGEARKIPRQKRKKARKTGPFSTFWINWQDPEPEFGAQERTRTSTPFRALAPEASASTNSATWA